MAYFPNGSAGCDYEQRYCSRCVHWKLDRKTETQGCAIYDAHLLHNYDQHDEPHVESILDLLIPRSADGLSNLQCRLFVTADEVRQIRREREDARQEKLPF